MKTAWHEYHEGYTKACATCSELRNQISILQKQNTILREALGECAHMLDVIYTSKYIKFGAESPCHQDIGMAKGLARKALEQTIKGDE